MKKSETNKAELLKILNKNINLVRKSSKEHKLLMEIINLLQSKLLNHKFNDTPITRRSIILADRRVRLNLKNIFHEGKNHKYESKYDKALIGFKLSDEIYAGQHYLYEKYLPAYEIDGNKLDMVLKEILLTKMIQEAREYAKDFIKEELYINNLKQIKL